MRLTARVMCGSTRRSVLWHCHLLRPQHYLESCTNLLGTVGVIDHDPGYISPKKIDGSSFVDKIELLYKRERKFFRTCSYACRIELEEIDSDTQSFIMSKEPEQWLDKAFPEEEMYYDDMECG